MENFGSLASRTRLYAQSILVDYPHQSWPVPLASHDGSKLCFMYCRAALTGPESGYEIWPPSYVLMVDPETGVFLRMTKVTPDNFGLSCQADKPADRQLEEHLVAALNMFRLYDALLPLFYQKARPERSSVKREFADLFGQVSEKPLVNFYRELAPEFFAWLAKGT